MGIRGMQLAGHFDFNNEVRRRVVAKIEPLLVPHKKFIGDPETLIRLQPTLRLSSAECRRFAGFDGKPTFLRPSNNQPSQQGGLMFLSWVRVTTSRGPRS